MMNNNDEMIENDSKSAQQDWEEVLEGVGKGKGVQDEPCSEPKSRAKSRKNGVLVGCLVFLCLISVGFGVTGIVLWLQERDLREQAESEKVVQIERVVEKVEVVKDDGGVITIETESLGKNEQKVREVVSEMRAEIVGWAKMKNAYGEWVSPVMYGVYDNFLPEYRPEGLEKAVSLNWSYGLKVEYPTGWDRTTRDAMRQVIAGEELREKMAEFLKEQGFEEYDLGDETAVVREMIDNENGVICVLGSGMDTLDFTCGHISWVDVEAESAR